MDYICFVKKENAKKAEDALRNDFDLAAKQSITIRDAASLEIKPPIDVASQRPAADGTFFLIEGSEEGITRCKELIKDFVAAIDSKKLEEAKKKIKEEQEAAASGFGGIFAPVV